MWSESLEAINIKAITIDNYGTLAFLFITEIFFFFITLKSHYKNN